MNFEVIVTLGPSILNHDGRLGEINALGTCIFRINGAHADAELTRKTIRACRAAAPDCRLMIDLPGNKIRTGVLEQPIRLVRGETVALRASETNYPAFAQHLAVGDEVLANDSVYRLEVVEIRDSDVVFLSHSDGLLTSNKGLHARGASSGLPFLFPRDLDLIEVGVEEGVDCISLSFVRHAKDVREAQMRIGNGGPAIVAKIETAAALENLGSILPLVDTVNVDRGDLSADIGLLAVARAQQRIIDSATRAGKRVFLATQFLKHMENSPVPLIAEVMDLHKTVLAGVTGIQLSEETAVGRHPVECVKLLFDVFHGSFTV